MKRIISREDSEKKRRRNQILIGSILILVMVASTIGYSLSGGEKAGTKQIVYNGFKFMQENGLWNANIKNFKFSFKYNPYETEKINSALNPLSNYSNQPLYIYSENAEATAEIYRNIFYQNQIVQRMQNACPEGKECGEDIPSKNCADNFIIIEKSDSSSIVQDDNCVFIKGDYENLTKLSDSFLFNIIGVQ